MVRYFRLLLALAIAITGGTAPAVAGSAAPGGAPILVVSGKIANPNDGDVARFDRDTLETIGIVRLTTLTPWDDGPVEFEGVSMRSLMRFVGAKGTEVLATALDDYRTLIPISDFDHYDVVLATRRNGEPLPIRDKGPLFIVYPFDSNPRLKTEEYYSRAVWQLKELNVR